MTVTVGCCELGSATPEMLAGFMKQVNQIVAKHGGQVFNPLGEGLIFGFMRTDSALKAGRELARLEPYGLPVYVAMATATASPGDLQRAAQQPERLFAMPMIHALALMAEAYKRRDRLALCPRTR